MNPGTASSMAGVSTYPFLASQRTATVTATETVCYGRIQTVATTPPSLTIVPEDGSAHVTVVVSRVRLVELLCAFGEGGFRVAYLVGWDGGVRGVEGVVGGGDLDAERVGKGRVSLFFFCGGMCGVADEGRESRKGLFWRRSGMGRRLSGRRGGMRGAGLYVVFFLLPTPLFWEMADFSL